MPEVTHRTITTYRWICTNRERCEVLDELIGKIGDEQKKLSYYVANGHITGINCVTLGNKFKYMLADLMKERKTLWRRVKRVTQEDIESEDITPSQGGINA